MGIQANFYNKLYKNYHKHPIDNKTTRNIVRFLDIVIKKKCVTVLELGCGTGLLTEFLLNRFNHVIAIDLSNTAVKTMTKRFGVEISKNHLTVIQADALRYLECTDDYYHLIIASGILHHINSDQWQKLFKLSYSRLLDGGILAFGPEPNAGGMYSLVWKCAKIVYRLYSIDYNLAVEKGTFNMLPGKIKNLLIESGFRKVDIIGYQTLPDFNTRALEKLNEVLYRFIPGYLSTYLTIRAEK